MKCMDCNRPTDGVELSPGCKSAICLECSNRRHHGQPVLASLSAGKPRENKNRKTAAARPKSRASSRRKAAHRLKKR